MSKWIDFIREYARQKGITYSCALSDPNCSIAYQAQKLTDIRQKDYLASERKRIEIRQNRRRNLNELKDTMTKKKEKSENISMQAEDVNVSGRPRANTRLTEETYQEKIAPKKVVITGEKRVGKRPKKEVMAEAPPSSNQPAVVEPVAKKAGRKSKYATEEEKKKAKREQTLVSNKRRYYEKKIEKDTKL